MDSPKVLYSKDTLATRVGELGARISADYQGRSLVVLVVLKGSFMFAADLVRAINVPLRVDFLGLASYGANTRSTGTVQITQDLTSSVDGMDVLVVEDIVDTGLTLDYLLRQLHARNPHSVRVCALLHKPARSQVSVPIDYLGFTIEDVFVVGYGMDHAQLFRNVPYVGVLERT